MPDCGSRDGDITGNCGRHRPHRHPHHPAHPVHQEETGGQGVRCLREREGARQVGVGTCNTILGFLVTMVDVTLLFYIYISQCFTTIEFHHKIT